MMQVTSRGMTLANMLALRLHISRIMGWALASAMPVLGPLGACILSPVQGLGIGDCKLLLVIECVRLCANACLYNVWASSPE